MIYVYIFNYTGIGGENAGGGVNKNRTKHMYDVCPTCG